MQHLLNILIHELDVERAITVVFLLAARLGPLVFVAPFLGGQKIPAVARTVMVTAIGIAMWPAAWASSADLPAGGGLVILIMVKEGLVGTVLALMATILIRAVEAAGRLMDVARGSQMAQVLTPAGSEPSSPLGALMLLTTLVIFMGINGHHMVLEAVGRSYQVLPLHRWPSQAAWGSMARLALWMGSEFFLVALGLAAPVLAMVFLTELATGLAGRMAPQMPTYFLALPLKGYAALLVLLMAIFWLFRWMDRVFYVLIRGVETAARSLVS